MATLTRKISVYSDGSITVANTPQPSRMLAIMKRDQYTYYWNFKVRSVAPNPAVFRTGHMTDYRNFSRSNLTKQVQFFWADCLAMQKYGKLYAALTGDQKKSIQQAFSGMSRGNAFLTNGAGTDTKNNYVTGEANRGEDPKIDPLICGGSIVEILELKPNSQGLIMARLNTFRAGQALPVVTADLLNNDPRILSATIINKDGELSNFPQLAGMRNPYPYVSAHDVWFPMRDLEIVTTV
jgi:hypothetical protein